MPDRSVLLPYSPPPDLTAGVLSCDPAAATFGQGTGGPFLEEEEAHNPPPSQASVRG